MNNTANNIFYGDKLKNQFTAYVEQALKNNRISYYRKNKSRTDIELLFASEDALETHIGISNDMFDNIFEISSLQPDFICHEGLSQELRNISKKDFIIIQLRIIYGYAYKQIAAIMDMKESTVRIRYYRAIQKIRDNLGGCEINDI